MYSSTLLYPSEQSFPLVVVEELETDRRGNTSPIVWNQTLSSDEVEFYGSQDENNGTTYAVGAGSGFGFNFTGMWSDTAGRLVMDIC